MYLCPIIERIGDAGWQPRILKPSIFLKMAHANEPAILTANTYFWTPKGNASARRRSEDSNLETVGKFFREIGLKTEINGNTVTGESEKLIARFKYSESCKNVYKNLLIEKNGKRSNITALRKMYAQ